MQPLRISVRPAQGSGAADGFVELGLDRPGLALVPDVVGPLRLADALRAALGGSLAGAAEAGAPEGGLEVRLDLALVGGTFRVRRTWSASQILDGEAVLWRLGGADASEPVAEGSEAVTEALRALSAAGDAARRLVLPVDAIADALDAAGPEARAGYVPALHARLAREVEPLARSVGGRVRELLQAAHDVLRHATETLAPDEPTVLTPEDLAARRDELVARLARCEQSQERLDAAAAEAARLVQATAERVASIASWRDAEDAIARLEMRRNLHDGNRRRLERARAAAELAQALGRPPLHGEQDEAQARERAKAAVEHAWMDARSARKAHQVEESREREREALREWLDRLDGLGEAVTRLEEARAELVACEHDAARAGDVLEAARAEARALDTRRAALTEEIARATEGPEHLGRLRAEVAELARVRDSVARMAHAREKLREQARLLQVAKLQVDQADEEIESAQRELEYRRRSHVPPAGPPPPVAELMAERVTLVAEVERQSALLAAVREDLRVLTAELGLNAYRTPEMAEAAWRDKVAELARWGGTERSRGEVQADMEAADARRAELGALLEKLALAAGEAGWRRQAARARVAEREQALPENLRDRTALEAARAQARDELARSAFALDDARRAMDRAEDVLRRAEDALRLLERSARGALVDLGTEARRRMREAGFETVDDVEAARLPEAELARLEREVADHEAQLAEARRRADAGRDAAARPRPDLEQVERLAGLVEHARSTTRATRKAAARELALVDPWLDRLDALGSELEGVEASAGMDDAGDVAAGATFEQRATDGLLQLVVRHAGERLARWRSSPWALRWRAAVEGRSEGRWLEVRAGDVPVDLHAQPAVERTLLAVALASGLASVLEAGRGPLPALVLDGALAIGDGDAAARVLAALDEVAGRAHALAVPCGEADRARLEPLRTAARAAWQDAPHQETP